MNAITIAYSKRETTDVYLFDILCVNNTNSFKVGCAVVNVKTGRVGVHGCGKFDDEFTKQCLDVAKSLCNIFGE